MAKTTPGVEYPAPGEDPQAWSEEGGRHRRPDDGQAAMDEVKEHITLYNQIIERLQRRQLLFDASSNPFGRWPVRRAAVINDHGFVQGLLLPDDRCAHIVRVEHPDRTSQWFCHRPAADHPTMWGSHRSDPWEMPRSGHAGRALDNPSPASSVLSAVPPWQKHLLDRFTRAEGDTGEHLLAMMPPQQGWHPDRIQRAAMRAAGIKLVEYDPATGNGVIEGITPDTVRMDETSLVEDRIPTKEDWKRWVAEGKAELHESGDGNVWIGVRHDGGYHISVPSEQTYEFLPTPEGMKPDVPIEDFP